MYHSVGNRGTRSEREWQRQCKGEIEPECEEMRREPLWWWDLY